MGTGTPKVDSYSAFIEADGKLKTGLDGYLEGRGIKTIFVAGLAGGGLDKHGEGRRQAHPVGRSGGGGVEVLDAIPGFIPGFQTSVGSGAI